MSSSNLLAERIPDEDVKQISTRATQKFLNMKLDMHYPVQEYINDLPHPVLPVVLNGKVELPQKRDNKYEKQDVAIVQLEDIGEKIIELVASLENYKLFKENATRAQYRRLEETCIRYSLLLDRVNVNGREDVRIARRSLLLYMDKLSAEVVNTKEG